MTGFVPKGKTINLDFCDFGSKKEVSIGRSSQCDITLIEDGISRHHADILMNEEGLRFLRDSSSTNGTSIDGKRLVGEKLYQIKNGQEIKFFKTKITFLFSEGLHQKQSFESSNVISSTPSSYASAMTGASPKANLPCKKTKVPALDLNLSEMLMDEDGESCRIFSQNQQA